MATARVRGEFVGGRRIMQVLNGIRRAMGRTNRQQRTESGRTRRAVERNERAEAQVTQRTERTKRREVRLTERERQRTFRAEVNRQRRAIVRQRRIERARQRAEQQLARRRRGPGVLGTLGRVGGALAVAGAGAGLGALRGAFGVARELQGALGIRSQSQIIGSAVDQRQAFIRSAVQGGLRGPQIQSAIERSAGIAERTGVSPETILQGIGVAQERFSQLLTATQGGDAGIEDFFTNIEFMAQVSRATGASMEDVVGAAGEFQRQFGLDAAGTRDALSLIAEGALQGSLSLRDFADRFPAAIASFQASRGVSGIDALREFQAIAQALRASGLDPRRARTYQQNLLSTLVRRQSQLRAVGIDVRGEGGRIRSVADIVRQATDEERAQDPRRLLRALGSTEAFSALSALVQQEQRARAGQGGAMTLQERIDVDIEHGASLFSDTMEELNQDASGEVIRQRIAREAQLVAQSDQLIARFASLTRVLTELEDRDPLLTTVGAPIAGNALGGIGFGLLASRLIGGGATAATAGTAGAGLLSGAAGGGGIAAAAGTGVGAAGAGALALFTAAGLAIAAAVTAGISATGLFEDSRQRSLLEQWGDIGSDIETAFGGGVIESLETAFSGPAESEDPAAVLARRRASKDVVALDPETIRQLKPPREPGAGRRAEGAPSE